jgi:hypothetical protein
MNLFPTHGDRMQAALIHSSDRGPDAVVEARSRKRCPLTCAAEGLVYAVLDSGSVVEAARERVEQAGWTLSDMARAGKELTTTSAEVLAEHLMSVTLEALD